MICKRSASIVWLVLIVMTMFFIYYGNAKQGMFLDEIYTYCLSNANVDSLDPIPQENAIISRETIINALEVQDNERFAAKSVYYNQSLDVHPPLYYLVVNFVSSIFCNSHSKWIGLGINYVLFVFIICLLFLLAQRMFGTSRAAAVVTCLYTFSLAGLSMLIYIRMYAMLTFFTLLLAIEILGLMRNNDRWFHYFAITITICCGLLTHYYFVIYAFFACLSYFIVLVKRKTYLRAIYFSVASLLGVAIMVLLFPPVISQLTSSEFVSGTTALSQLAEIKKWPYKIGIHILVVGYYLLFAFVLSAVYCISLTKHRKFLSVDKHMRSLMMVIVLPAFISFVLVSIIAPYNGVRYIYNIIPIALLVLPFFDYVLSLMNNNKVNKTILYSALICLLLNVCFTVIRKPDNLYEEDETSNLIVREFEDSKCLFFSSNGWAPFASALQLLTFEEFYLLSNSVTEQAIDYINSEEDNNLVVFIDIDNSIGRGLNPKPIVDEILQKTEYCHYKLLFTNDNFSAAYLLSK